MLALHTQVAATVLSPLSSPLKLLPLPVCAELARAHRSPVQVARGCFESPKPSPPSTLPGGSRAAPAVCASHCSTSFQAGVLTDEAEVSAPLRESFKTSSTSPACLEGSGAVGSGGAGGPSQFPQPVLSSWLPAPALHCLNWCSGSRNSEGPV